jgi:hypothetical protein
MWKCYYFGGWFSQDPESCFTFSTGGSYYNIQYLPDWQILTLGDDSGRDLVTSVRSSAEVSRTYCIVAIAILYLPVLYDNVPEGNVFDRFDPL